MKILEEIKNLIEVDVEETIYDSQLLLYANSGIQYLINNNVPIGKIEENSESTEWNEIDEDDYLIILDWLHLRILQRFDRTLMTGNQTTTATWIDSEMTNLIYQLKCKYDRSDRS
ncbi:phage head-tail connector protein [Enterococcus sp. BWR-S5]|uniref:phage head-tail connector protein n=1 Tax=Enterococcus sp. BWR-S5 TaxID=2787714 RepID=UPI001923DFA0|nr:hypothetical protein [Enterococcus sp. BWR-S5]MBL1223730.1 hypothetical protein [Enterococcus sp. BWR-S5]